MSRRFELFQKALDSDGDPVSGATLEFFVGGSSFGTAKDVYSDADLTTPISQPITYNAAGNRAADIFCAGALYDVRFTVGSTITTIANYDPGLAVGLGVSSVVPVAFGGTGANNAATARSNIGAASNDAVTDAQENITDLQTQIAPGLNGSNVLGVVAALASVAPANMSSQVVLLQEPVRLTTPSNTNVNSAIPADTSKPQSGEGVLVFSQSFTPISASSKVRITCRLRGEPAISTTATLVGAIFLNSDADAIASNAIATTVNTSPLPLDITHQFAPGSTSTITIKVRAGISTGTYSVNGSTVTFGSTLISELVIEEYLTKA